MDREFFFMLLVPLAVIFGVIAFFGAHPPKMADTTSQVNSVQVIEVPQD